MEEETEHVASTTSGSTESWINSHEILKLISFDASALGEDKAACSRISCARPKFSLVSLAKFSSTTALCSRMWCYKKPNANVRTEEDVERFCKRERLSGAGGTVDMVMVQDAGVGIKTESSDMKAVQEKTVVLK